MCFGELWIQFQGLLDRAAYFWTDLIRGSTKKTIAEILVGFCQPNVSRCKRRVPVIAS
jgi:hypothetical protein